MGVRPAVSTCWRDARLPHRLEARAPEGIDSPSLRVTTAHAESLAFAERLVRNARRRAKRAIAHLESMERMNIAPAIKLAANHCEIATGAFRAALGKRAFEIREL